LYTTVSIKITALLIPIFFNNFKKINSLQNTTLQIVVIILLSISRIIYTDNVIYTDTITSLIVWIVMWVSRIIYLSIITQQINTIVYYLIIIGSIIVFIINNTIIFFIFFERVALIIILNVIKYGYYKDRFIAAIYFIIYTSTAMLPTFFFFLINQEKGLTSHYILNSISTNSVSLSIIILIGFLVKLPVYPFHLWLIKTHLEAPVEGSIILAGILLKLGTYGIIRFSSIWITVLYNHMNIIFLPFTIAGAFIISMNCLFSQDYKLLVSISSIVHINIALFCCLQIEEYAIATRIIIIVRHALSSSGLFNLRNLIYNKVNRRRFFMAKRLIASSPYIVIWILLLLISNIAIPPTINLSTELQAVTIIVIISRWFILVTATFCFIAGLYSIYFYYIVINGNINNYTIMIKTTLMHDLIYFIHLAPLFIFLLWTNNIF